MALAKARYQELEAEFTQEAKDDRTWDEPSWIPYYVTAKLAFIEQGMEGVTTREPSAKLIKQADAKAIFVTTFANNGASISASATAAGINRRTYLNWRKEDTVFRSYCDDASEFAIDEVESMLFAKAVKGDMRAITFFLQGKRPSVWRKEIDEVSDPIDMEKERAMFVINKDVKVQMEKVNG